MSDSKLGTLNRRRLLHAAGLASGSLFLPSLIGDKAAYAQAAALKRLLVFYTQHGPVMNRWELRPQGMDATPQGEWELPLGPLAQTDFGETLQPLHPYRDDVLQVPVDADAFSLETVHLGAYVKTAPARSELGFDGCCFTRSAPP